MTTAGTPAGEIEKPGTTAAAATKDAAAATTTDKTTATPAADATTKPITTDPADKGTGAPADAQAVAKPTSLLDDVSDDDDGEDEGTDTTASEGDRKPTVAGEFPDDWREKLAKGDDKKLTRLKRYKSYEDFANAGLAAQDKIRSGDYKAKLADDATPEEKSAWRKENGIPDEPKAYEVPKVPGHEWTEGDVPLLEGFKAVAHDANLSQAQLDKTLRYYGKLIEDAKQHQAETLKSRDVSDKQAVEDALRAKLGGEYRPSLQLFNRFLTDQEVFPEGMADRIAQARFPDGTRVIHDPVMADFFIGLARERYGDSAFITGDAKATMVGEEEKCREIMKNDSDRYFREGWDKKLTEILNRKAGTKGRAA